MSIGNPYKHRKRLPHDSNMFFGRKQEMERLEDMLSSNPPQNVSIVGERRIGKSSLVNRVYHKIKQKSNTLAIYLDLDSLHKECKTNTDFFLLLNRCFKETVTGTWNVNEGEKEYFYDYRGFKSFVGNLSGKKMKIIIFLDEFEHLPDKKFANNSFFSNLRAMADNPDYSLAFVTISKTEIKELTHQAIQSSCFYNIFETHIIGLLDHNSIKQLRRKGFQQAPFNMSKEENKEINFNAGDFAFFNQIACAFLWDVKNYKNTPDWDDLKDKLLPYYEDLWDSRSRQEQKLLIELRNGKESNDLDIHRMSKRGLLKKAVDRYYFFSKFLGQLIETRFEVTQKDISEKKNLSTTKEFIGVLNSAKGLVSDKGV